MTVDVISTQVGTAKQRGDRCVSRTKAEHFPLEKDATFGELLH